LNEILDYLTNAKIMELAKDSRVLFGAGVLFILALIFRWKYLLALLFGLGGTIVVIRFANLGEGEVAINENLITFGLGAVLVAGVLIYFLFIRSD
jgi:hypothetical protein